MKRQGEDDLDPWYKDALRARFEDYKKQSLAGLESWAGAPDAHLILRLLRGTTWEALRPTPSPPRMPIRYLTRAEETESRKALADLLRSRKRPAPYVLLPEIKLREALLNEVCHRLADLIDPDCKSPRKIDFTKPQGGLSQDDTHKLIVFQVRRKLAECDTLTVEEAVAEVAKEYKRSGYKRSESWILKLYSREQARNRPARRRRRTSLKSTITVK